MLFVAFAFTAIHYGVIAFDVEPWYNPTKAALYSVIMQEVCFIISGTVKISVALVIYRLVEHRPVLKAIVIAYVVGCIVWTLVSTVILSLGCTGTYISPYIFNGTLCENITYAQESSYVIFSVFLVAFPTALLWNTHIRHSHKAAVFLLFGLGLLYVTLVSYSLAESLTSKPCHHTFYLGGQTKDAIPGSSTDSATAPLWP